MVVVGSGGETGKRGEPPERVEEALAQTGGRTRGEGLMDGPTPTWPFFFSSSRVFGSVAPPPAKGEEGRPRKEVPRKEACAKDVRRGSHHRGGGWYAKLPRDEDGDGEPEEDGASEVREAPLEGLARGGRLPRRRSEEGETEVRVVVVAGLPLSSSSVKGGAGGGGIGGNRITRRTGGGRWRCS